MNDVIKILIERDNITKREATKLVNDTKKMILNNPDEAEQILIEELNLEMDYIFDILF